VTTDLDRLELELRCVPGVVAVGLDRDSDGDGLLVQAVVLASVAPTEPAAAPLSSKIATPPLWPSSSRPSRSQSSPLTSL